MKFLVIGGNGYIGSHMCKYLFKMGHEVSIIDNFITSFEPSKHKYGEFINIDYGDYDKVFNYLNNNRFDCIFHFAGRILVPESEQSPFLYYDENIKKFLSLLKAITDTGVHNFIFSSTCATYEPSDRPLTENSSQSSSNVYGSTKYIAEIILKDMCRLQKINSVVLRYFNVCGSDPELEIGEEHQPETHLIPKLCQSVLNEEDCSFTVFGDDYDTPDGTCIRDYIHVEDLVRGHHLAANYISKRRGFDSFNLGTGNGSSVLEVIKLFEDVTGKKINVNIQKRRAGDVSSLTCRPEKANEILQFKTEYSLRDAISHCFKFYKKINKSDE